MEMPRKSSAPVAVRAPTPAQGELARHSVPWGREEMHMGALESQMSVTLPPMVDDDEPKQG